MEQKEEFDKRYLLMQPILSRTSRALSETGARTCRSITFGISSTNAAVEVSLPRSICRCGSQFVENGFALCSRIGYDESN